MEKNNQTINVDDMDRDLALLIFMGKIYEHDNHQFALKDAMDEHGLDFASFEEIDKNIDKYAKFTNNKSKTNEISTFSVFDEEYLIAHYKDNLFENLDIIKKYAEEKNYKVGYFIDFEGGDCILIS
ncbi:hypothetical protein C4D27_16855 [Clostridium perfringens]